MESFSEIPSDVLESEADKAAKAAAEERYKQIAKPRPSEYMTGRGMSAMMGTNEPDSTETALEPESESEDTEETPTASTP